MLHASQVYNDAPMSLTLFGEAAVRANDELALAAALSVLNSVSRRLNFSAVAGLPSAAWSARVPGQTNLNG